MLRLWTNFKRQLSGVTDVDTYPVSIPTGLIIVIYGYTHWANYTNRFPVVECFVTV